MGLGLVYEDYHNKNRARERFDAIIRDMGDNSTGELVFTLPVERFEIWYTEFTSEVN